MKIKTKIKENTHIYKTKTKIKDLDNFFIQEGITNISFSRDQAVKWKQQLENESKNKNSRPRAYWRGQMRRTDA